MPSSGMSRRTILVCVGLLTLAAATAALAQPIPQLLYNGSASEPEGWYVRSPAPPALGRLIAFRVPPAGRAYARAHLPSVARGSILKTIAAVQGDKVCAVHNVLSVNGRVLGQISVRDRQGRGLPQWRGCRPMGRGEYFVFSDRIANSFDSRYYGPVRQDDLIGVYRPLRGLGSPSGARKA